MSPTSIESPASDLIWRHVTLTLRLNWLPGDPRGFRDHGHRIHSSGDYHNPPPPGEHAGLHRYARRLASGDPIRLNALEVRQALGVAMLSKMNDLEIEALAMAVCPRHVHLQARLPRSPLEAKALIGRVKQHGSHSIRSTHPGSLWARGGSYKPIRDRSHQLMTFRYVAFKQEPGSVAWTSRHGWFRIDVDRRPCRFEASLDDT